MSGYDELLKLSPAARRASLEIALGGMPESAGEELHQTLLAGGFPELIAADIIADARVMAAVAAFGRALGEAAADRLDGKEPMRVAPGEVLVHDGRESPSRSLPSRFQRPEAPANAWWRLRVECTRCAWCSTVAGFVPPKRPAKNQFEAVGPDGFRRVWKDDDDDEPSELVDQNGVVNIPPECPCCGEGA
jgi:hypothetical protein